MAFDDKDLSAEGFGIAPVKRVLPVDAAIFTKIINLITLW